MSPTEEQLLAAAMQADQARASGDDSDFEQPLEPTAPEPSEPSDAPEAPDTSKHEDSPPEPDEEQPEPPAPAKPKPSPKATDKPQGEVAKTPYQKERERQDRSWKKIQEEKQKLAKERQELEDAKKRLQPPPAPAKPPAQKPPVNQPPAKPEHPPEAYERVAERKLAEADRLERSGDLEAADQARAIATAAERRAKALREAPPVDDRVPVASLDDAQFTQHWAQAEAQLKTLHPEVTTPGSPIDVAIREIFKEEPRLFSIPDGPLVAARYAKDRLAARRVPELEAENKRLAARVQALEKRTALHGAPPAGLPAPTAFTELSDVQREDLLRKQLEEVDAAGERLFNR